VTRSSLLAAHYPIPTFIPPELVTLVDKAPEGDGWLHEIKLDGCGTAGRLEGGMVCLLTRTDLDWTARFRPIATALVSLPAKAAYLDGEVAVVGPDEGHKLVEEPLRRSCLLRLRPAAPQRCLT
jgi:bifunctional non-homologous end joining protein LigD